MKNEMSLSLFAGKPGVFVRATVSENNVTFTIPVENALRNSLAEIDGEKNCFVPWETYQKALDVLLQTNIPARQLDFPSPSC